MNYKAIYRKYRPSTFEDIAGQQHIVTTLTNAIEQERLSHAYLFSGPSGNGKTSIAKLFAKAVNCESEDEIICNQCANCLAANKNNHPDIVEMDAASNNGVDDIRNLIEKVKYAPLTGKYKIYIIDEVHMLSLGAFNALLKTLEEPPAHVIFILATTEPHKVIPTIMSRCQRYDFTKVSNDDIKMNIEKILKKEDIGYEEAAIDLICELSEGGVRKSLSILEQVVAYSIDNITVTDIIDIYGLVTKEQKLELLELCYHQDIEKALALVTDIYNRGNDLERFISDLVNIIKELIIFKFSFNPELLETLTVKEAEHFVELYTSDQLLQIIDYLNIDSTVNEDYISYLELAIIKIVNLSQPALIKEEQLDLEEESEEEVTQEDLDRIFAESEKTKQRVLEEYDQKADDKDDETIKEDKKPLHKEKIEVKDQESVEEKKDKVLEEDKTTRLEPKDKVYSDLDIISLLAHADKEKRIKMQEKWVQLSELNQDMKNMRYVKKLNKSTILASGDQYLVIVVEDDPVANSINTEQAQLGITEFLETIYHEKLLVIAITVSKSKEIIEEFKKLLAAKSLPDKIEVVVPENKEKEETLEDKAQSLFGNNYEIIGDE